MSVGRAGSVALVIFAISHSIVFTSTVIAQRGSRAPDAGCEITTPLTAVPGLREGSSLALSRRLPRRLFTINDSGAPEIVVLNLDGTIRGEVGVKNATVVDWEDVTSGSCPGGTCLYVGDIGDNTSSRPSIAVYRLLEPKDGDEQASAVRFEAIYPDGARDAEAMFTTADGRLYLITKETRGATLYAFPALLSADTPNHLERMAALTLGSGRMQLARVTDAEGSADGRRVAIRTNDALFLIDTDALLSGTLSGARTITLRPLGEPKGEGIALGADGQFYLVGEAGGRNAGTFAALRCMARP